MSTETKPARIELERTMLLARHAVTLVKTDQGGTVQLRKPDGAEALRIEVTAHGATLHLTRGLSIVVEGDLSLEAERVTIRGRRGVSLESEADASISVEGDLTCSSRSHTMTTSHGDIVVDANDDVVMRGERVRVNC
jgi:hypothetical protein